MVDIFVFVFAFEEKISNLSKQKKKKMRNRLDIIYSGFSKIFDKILGENRNGISSRHIIAYRWCT